MSGTAFVVGAELVLGDKFSPELRRLIEGLEGAKRLTAELQGSFDKLGLGPVVKRMKAEWDEINRLSTAGAEKVIKTISGLGTEGAAEFNKMTVGANEAFGKILSSSVKMQGDVLEEMEALSTGSVEALRGIGIAAPGIFDPLVGAAEASARRVEGVMAGITRSVESASARMNAGSAAAAFEGHASLRTRTLGAHAANNAHAGGVHFGRMGAHVGGAHASMGGDGIVPAVAGGVMLEILKKGVEEKWDFDHWASGYAGAGFNAADIDKAKRASWANAGRSPNASAIDGMKNILELNKATGSLDESIDLLPLFSRAEMAMQSVKAEGLHSKFNGGTQILNLAKGLEEMGYTTKGNTPEERQANIEQATNELIKTMVASRGLFDGNKLFAMTNNSGGAAQNWDLRFGTTIAPIIGDIMNHSKLGNADYMSLKSFQGGHITSDAVSALVKYHLASTGEGGDAYQDKKGNWHLKANSSFAKGMESNLFDWSGGVLEKLKANGYDTNNQEFMNGVVNEIGSNKSNSMLMRAVLEPGTRRQIQKEIDLRDKVPDDVAGVLQKSDPVLKLDAMHKKLEDFYTALGEGVAGPAIAGLTKLTAGINALSQAMEVHPDITKYAAGAAAVGGTALFGYGAGKMLGVFGGGDAGLSTAALKLDAAAEHLMLVGGGAPGTPSGAASMKNGGKGPGGAVAEGLLSGIMYDYGVKGMDWLLGWTPANQKTLDRATSGAATLDRLRGLFGGGVTSSGSSVTNSDGNALHRWDEMPAKAAEKFGALTDKTGLVLTSFDTLKGGGAALNDNFRGISIGSGGLDNAFKILEATAMGAARQLANVAMSGGGVGGGSGFMSASFGGSGGGSWGGNALAVSGGFGNGSWSKSGATRPEVASYIKAQAAKLGIDPNVALRVSQSEGFNTYTGDYGTSFGPFQLHYGGSGIRGMNSGGLGDAFTRATGLNARDPTTWKAQVDFALRQAKQGGWSPWHGAAHVGIGSRQGLDWHGSIPSDGPARKAISPGSPGGMSAANMPPIVIENHNHTHLDGKQLAKSVTRHQAVAGRFPTSGGGPDMHSHYSNAAGTPVTDAA